MFSIFLHKNTILQPFDNNFQLAQHLFDSHCIKSLANHNQRGSYPIEVTVFIYNACDIQIFWILDCHRTGQELSAGKLQNRGLESFGWGEGSQLKCTIRTRCSSEDHCKAGKSDLAWLLVEFPVEMSSWIFETVT